MTTAAIVSIIGFAIFFFFLWRKTRMELAILDAVALAPHESSWRLRRIMKAFLFACCILILVIAEPLEVMLDKASILRRLSTVEERQK